jgi:hypothetical protein
MLGALCKCAHQHRGALARWSQARCHAQAHMSAADSVQHFRHMLGESAVVTAAEQLQQYNTDWTGQFHGSSGLALQPQSAYNVSHILQFCNEHRCNIAYPHTGDLLASQSSLLVLLPVALQSAASLRLLAMRTRNRCCVCAAPGHQIHPTQSQAETLIPCNDLAIAHGRQRAASSWVQDWGGAARWQHKLGRRSCAFGQRSGHQPVQHELHSGLHTSAPHLSHECCALNAGQRRRRAVGSLPTRLIAHAGRCAPC